MLNKHGFNLWANDYDKTVQVSEDNNDYPFAGYKNILNTVFNEAMDKENSTILDIGFGTAILTRKLYENGHTIFGIDFSSEMIAIAQEKMPNARLIEWDMNNGLPVEVKDNFFDTIISTYTLHHLTDKDKSSFIRTVMQKLKPNGKLLIGDIAFKNREELEQCRQDNMPHWDHDEYYLVYDELKEELSNEFEIEFSQKSHCGGIIIVS